MDTLYQTGNTIKLECTFHKKEDGSEAVLFNPEAVEFTVMNYKYEVLESHTLDHDNHYEGLGKWFFWFTLPMEETRLIYEWVGYLNGKDYRQRKTIRTTFI
jgi:hypothetical protein